MVDVDVEVKSVSVPWRGFDSRSHQHDFVILERCQTLLACAARDLATADCRLLYRIVVGIYNIYKFLFSMLLCFDN